MATTRDFADVGKIQITRRPCCWQCGSVRKLTAYHSAGGKYHLCEKCAAQVEKK